ncbi:unnamed protein product [Brachionus calyciflorus]|uniref:t-SNARE coiled-coil homology domain-containing protein n=1 Tax=Brachionus calyciflorus TaxID=104777 RepID=A0A813XRC3_9BILA|nr:unnamed protein product [Brachionus calyciflorus]
MTSTLIQSLRTSIQKLNQSINQIENLSNQIGTSRDSNDLRKKLADVQHSAKEIAQNAQKNLKELNSNPINNGSEFKIQKERLTDELVKVFKKFQQVAETSLRKEKQFELPEQSASRGGNVTFQNEIEEANFGLGRSTNYEQEQRNIQIKRDQDLQLVKDRENQIHQLESDIIDLNSMFKDLAIIVNDQQETIDAIENNINNAELSVINAKDELSEAVKSKSKARMKKIYLSIILLIIILVIVVIVVVSLKPWA